MLLVFQVDVSNAVPGTRYDVTISSISATTYSLPVSRTVTTNVTSKYMFSFFFFLQSIWNHYKSVGWKYLHWQYVHCMHENSLVIKAKWKQESDLFRTWVLLVIFHYFQRAKIIFLYLFVKWIRNTVNGNI